MVGKTESISLRRGLSLYKQLRGSPNWYARVYLPFDGRKNHTKTTGTTDRKLAEKLAWEFYQECLYRQKHGSLAGHGNEDKTPRRFDHIADEWLDQLQLEAGDDDRRVRHFKDCRSAVLGKTGFVAFFGKVDVNSITTDQIRQFIQFKKGNAVGGKLADSTIKRNIVLLNMLLKFAFDKRLLTSLPSMPRVPKVDNPRAWFDHDEYQRLHNAARGKAKAARNAGDQKAADDWDELSDFIIFMVGSFLRPSEWPFLQHKHVKVVDEGENPHLVLTVLRGKTGMRTSVTMETALTAYNRLVSRYGNAAERHLFKPTYLNRKTAQSLVADSFERLLRDTELKLDRFGSKRSTYSLRHTALMLRFMKGDNIDILNLAKNAGTSVDQLERFYLKRIDTAEKIENLQSFKGSKVKG